MAELYDQKKHVRRVRIKGIRLNERQKTIVVGMTLNPTGEAIEAVMSIGQFMKLAVMMAKLSTNFTFEELRWGNGDGEGESNGHDDHDDHQ